MVFFKEDRLNFILHFFKKVNQKFSSFSNMFLFKMFHLIVSFPFYFQPFVFTEILTFTNYSIKILTVFLQSILSSMNDYI